MPKYMWQASYTLDGARGLLKEGGTSRKATLEKAIGGLGGKIEAQYWTFGEDDVILIVDLPDNASAAGAALTVSAAGGVRLRTTVLLTAEEVDVATRTNFDYRAPGA